VISVDAFRREASVRAAAGHAGLAGTPPRVLIAGTGPVTDRLCAREFDDDEGRRLVRIIRPGSGSVVTWRRAQMVLLPAQGMDVAAIAEVAFTSEDRMRDVIRNSNADGLGSLYPKYRSGHPPEYFTLDGTDHPSHKEQASMIRRYIIWRNNHTYDQRLHRIVDRANVA
jgi:hypothetical protein